MYFNDDLTEVLTQHIDSVAWEGLNDNCELVDATKDEEDDDYTIMDSADVNDQQQCIVFSIMHARMMRPLTKVERESVREMWSEETKRAALEKVEEEPV